MFKKYKNLSLPVKAGLWFTILQYVQEAIIVLSTPLFTRLMSTDSYGTVNIYNTWQAILTVFLTLRLTSGIFQIQLFEYKEDRDNLTSSLLTLSTIWIGIGGLIVWIFHSFFSIVFELPVEMIAVMLIDIWAQMVLSFWLTRKRFEYNYIPCLFVIIGNCFIRTLASIAFVYVFRENQAFYKVLGNAIPETCVSIVLIIMMLAQGRKWFKFNYYKEAIRFNVVLIPGYLSGILLASSDRLMIDSYCGKTEVAKYSIAYSCAQLIQLLYTAVNWVFTPFAYECLDKKDHKSLRSTANILTVLMATLTAVLVAFAPEAISIFAPASYKSAIWVIPPAACGIFLTFVYGLFTNIEYFYKKNTYITIATIAGAAINIILNWLLIPRYGYLVASYTTLIGYLLMTILHYFFYKKIVSVDIYNLKFILASVCMLYVFGGVCLILYQHPFIRYGVVLILLFGIYANKNKVIAMLKTMRAVKK